MKHGWMTVLATAALSLSVAAQTATDTRTKEQATAVAASNADAGADTGTSNVLGSGTALVAELSGSVNAKKVKPGDSVKARLIQDVIYRGKLVLRTGTKLAGHVTMAKPRSKDDIESQLSVVFDKAFPKDSPEINFNAGIKAIAPGQVYSMVDKPDEMGPPPGISRQSSSNTPMPARPAGTTSGTTRGTPPTTNQTASTLAGTVSLSTPYTPIGGANNTRSSFESSGLLSAGSRGVYGIDGLMLYMTGTGESQRSVLRSKRDNVKLESGMQIVLQLNTPAWQ